MLSTYLALKIDVESNELVEMNALPCFTLCFYLSIAECHRSGKHMGWGGCR